MNNKDDILSKRIRERLKDFEQPVSDYIWSTIEKDMSPVVHVSRMQTLWGKFSIAASFLLILSLGTLFFLNHNDKEQKMVDKKIEKLTENSNQILLADDNTQENVEVQSKSNTKYTGSFKHKRNQSTTEPSRSTTEPSRCTDPEITKTESSVSQTKSVTSSDIEKNTPKEKNQQSQKSSSFYEDAKANDDLWRDSPSKKKKKRGISYALGVGNTGNFEAGENEFADKKGGQSYTFQGSPNMPDYLGNPIYSLQENNVETPADYHYDLPVSVGFTVRKHFSDIFALETGLVYTHLSSEGNVTASMVPITNNISLNYLGIPLKGVYSFYNNRRISVYASAGGMVEKSVYGKFKTTANKKVESSDLDVKELQWSVAGSVGVNIQLVKHLGLFVEPGVAYFFDDGNEVMTIRKDQPFNFNLSAGLRLTY